MNYDDYVKKVREATGRDITQDKDYDWKAANADGYIPKKGEHGIDKYKMPNHPTFSNESIYHGKDGNEGGQWEDNKNGTWNFIPGKTNMQNHSKQELHDYFDQHEPDSTLVYPLDGEESDKSEKEGYQVDE